MEKINVQEIKGKIINILKLKGPSLPIHISRETGVSMLFSAALLSELFSEKSLKISNLKVGGSPLYFLSGQENMLEKFHTHLPRKEKEAFLLLKNKRVLKDKEQQPAIRVALRNIRDFAFAFKNKDEIFWRFLGVPLEQIKNLLEKSEPKSQTQLKTQKKIKTQKKEIIKEKPLLTLKEKEEKQVKPKEKSDFVLSILNFLEKQDIPIAEEIEIKKKEFVGEILLNSDIGKLRFLCIAKDKKRVTENDFALALQKSQSEKLPILFISPGQPAKKAETYLENTNIIKFIKLNKQ